MASSQHMVVQTSPWLPGACITQDMPVSEGLWLNRTLPFNVTSSNTIFLFNCSPRLLVSPLNCTDSSLCHLYLESSGHVDDKRALECASSLRPCCTFVAGGMPSAYKIRLHSSGCRAFRSILHLDTDKPANQWEEGLEIQWAVPLEPVCKNQLDCSGASKCVPAGAKGRSRCVCNRGYHWDHILLSCMRKKSSTRAGLRLKVSIGVFSFFSVAIVLGAITAIDFSRNENDVNLVIFVSERATGGALMDVVDDRLLGKEPSGNLEISVRLFSELALACLQERKTDRPCMKDVVQELQHIIQTVDQEEV
ncbi:hypothetical protein HS088_TW03G00792 [Tripterygium wilfordii]|uniref:Wall-associated receptor kinase-like 20 n=1 Tax=Tripterygium wilfordii TaxID=458696 RepID=A0A7J7DWI3_TRIWF|nr:hypothetical protein HS088_TW03G00792 [Tripterygium wilfordii]